MCLRVLPASVYVYHMFACCLQSLEEASDPWNWSCGWLQATPCMWGTEPGSFVRATRALPQRHLSRHTQSFLKSVHRCAWVPFICLRDSILTYRGLIISLSIICSEISWEYNLESSNSISILWDGPCLLLLQWPPMKPCFKPSQC